MLVEIIFGTSLLILMLVFFVQSMKLPFLIKNGLMGAGFFPRILIIILIVLIIYYLVELILKRRRYPQKEPVLKSTVWQQCFLMVMMAVSLWAGDYLGMELTIGLFLLVTLVMVEKLSWVRAAIFSAAATVCIYFIFDVWLGLNLPKGILG
ncbi:MULTISPECIES: tripartite tricarboxylate transporter TctB family protein [unclassified Paenibacillus]|uniref:tripartite tricarboxylate transporter TctB family protein n=1 Tax=Paenibacillus TaxID=44249 RepID=UPI0021184F94|nr:MULTISPECIES: tripartite tricarboxylate transporter TctB family protein [unclassified Paenibacillus]